jgi:hypothetical protein
MLRWATSRLPWIAGECGSIAAALQAEQACYEIWSSGLAAIEPSRWAIMFFYRKAATGAYRCWRMN